MRTGQTSVFGELNGRAEEYIAIISSYKKVFTPFFVKRRGLEFAIAICLMLFLLSTGFFIVRRDGCLMVMGLLIGFVVLIASREILDRRAPRILHVAKLFCQFDVFPINQGEVIVCDPLRARAEIRWPNIDFSLLDQEIDRLVVTLDSLDKETALLSQLHALKTLIQSSSYTVIKAGLLERREPLLEAVAQAAAAGVPISQEWLESMSERICASDAQEKVRSQQGFGSLAVLETSQGGYRRGTRAIRAALDDRKRQAVRHFQSIHNAQIGPQIQAQTLEKVEQEYDVIKHIDGRVASAFDQVIEQLEQEEEFCDKIATITSEKDLKKVETDNEYHRMADQEDSNSRRNIQLYESNIESLREELEERRVIERRLQNQISIAQGQLEQLKEESSSEPDADVGVEMFLKSMSFAAETSSALGVYFGGRQLEIREDIRRLMKEIEDERYEIERIEGKISQYEGLIRQLESDSEQRLNQIDEKRREMLRTVEESKQQLIRQLRRHIDQLEDVRSDYIGQVSKWRRPLRVSAAVRDARSEYVQLNRAIIETRRRAVERLFDQCISEVMCLQKQVDEAVDWLAAHRSSGGDLSAVSAVLIPVWIVIYTHRRNEETEVEVLFPSQVSLLPQSLSRKILDLGRVRHGTARDLTESELAGEFASFAQRSPDLIEALSCLEDRRFLVRLPNWIRDRWQRADWISNELAERMLLDIQEKIEVTKTR